MLAKTPALLRITEKLAGKRPDWERLATNIRASLQYRQDMGTDNLSALASEVHIRDSLEDICEDMPRPKVIFDPILPTESRDGFSFVYERGRLIVYIDNRQRVYSELDEILLVGNVPVLFEVKLSRYRGGGGQKRTAHNWKKVVLRATNQVAGGVTSQKRTIVIRSTRSPSSSGVRVAMEHERVRYLLLPLIDYFGTSRCGYVLVTDPAHIRPDDPLQADFARMGGILVPFYTGRKAFREEVAQMRTQYKF